MRVDKRSFDLNFNSLSLNIINLLLAKTGYFTVIVGSEAGVDLVLITYPVPALYQVLRYAN